MRKYRTFNPFQPLPLALISTSGVLYLEDWEDMWHCPVEEQMLETLTMYALYEATYADLDEL